MEIVLSASNRRMEVLLGVVGGRELAPAGTTTHEPGIGKAVVNRRLQRSFVPILIVECVVVCLMRVVIGGTRSPNQMSLVDTQSGAYLPRHRSITADVQSQSAGDKRARPGYVGKRRAGIG